MKKHLALMTFFCVFLLCTSCSKSSRLKSKVRPETVNTYVQCEEPRLQMCTREYMPVCAIKEAGKPCNTPPCSTTESHSYANACTACADKTVIKYMSGACE